MLNITLAIKVVMCFVGLCLSVGSFKVKLWKNIPLKVLIFLGYSWRYVFFFAWFILLSGNVSGDVSGYDIHTRWTIDGLIPNRDYSTPYGFYLNYLNAALYSVWASPVSLVIAYQLLEVLGTIMIARTLSGLYNEYLARHYVILYCFNPFVITWFAFDGQEESLLIPFIGILLLSYISHRPRISGFVSSVMIFMVKPSSILISAPFMILSTSRKHAGVSFVFLSAILVVLPISLGSTVFSSSFSRPDAPGDLLSNIIMPGNIWFVVKKFGLDLSASIIPKLTFSLLFLLLISVIYLARKRDFSVYRISIACILMTLAYQITSPYTSPGFFAAIVTFMVIFVLTILHFKGISFRYFSSFFLVWSFLTSLDMPVYFRFAKDLKEFVIGQVVHPMWIAHAFIVWEIFIVLSNIVIFVVLLRLYLESPSNPIEEGGQRVLLAARAN